MIWIDSSMKRNGLHSTALHIPKDCSFSYLVREGTRNVQYFLDLKVDAPYNSKNNHLKLGANVLSLSSGF
jgi:hypothetical protein